MLETSDYTDYLRLHRFYHRSFNLLDRKTYLMGFTFLEIMFSLVILSIALIPIMTLVPTGISTKIKVEQNSQAIFLAQSKMEEMNNFVNDYNNPTPTAFFEPHQDFLYTTTDDLNDSLKTLSVKVWHKNRPQDAIIFYKQISHR